MRHIWHSYVRNLCSLASVVCAGDTWCACTARASESDFQDGTHVLCIFDTRALVCMCGRSLRVQHALALTSFMIESRLSESLLPKLGEESQTCTCSDSRVSLNPSHGAGARHFARDADGRELPTKMNASSLRDGAATWPCMMSNGRCS